MATARWSRLRCRGFARQRDRVGRPLEMLREVWVNVLDELVAHAAKVTQVTVVGQRDASPR